MRSMFRFVAPVLVALSVFAGVARAQMEPGLWRGVITLPTGALAFSVLVIDDPAEGPRATIAIPIQGIVGADLSGLSVEGRAVTFRFGPSGASFSGELRETGRELVGTLRQAGQSMPFNLRYVGPATAHDDPAADALPAIEQVAQRWRGVAELPGVELEFMIHVEPAPTPTGWRGTVDIPLQGVQGLPLRDVRVAEEIGFTIQADGQGAPPPAIFTLRRIGADDAEGSFSQAGSVFTVKLRRVHDPDETVELPRPQTPKPPFPYTEREVKYSSPVDGVTLAGTLTMPPGDGPHPAVLFITGSGAQDRDETIAGHKPFWVLADFLARLGVASLRVDDRGVGGSGGNTLDATSETSVMDIIAGAAFLSEQPGIDAARIGLLGHSEGGWLAPIAATRTDLVGFLILLAPPGVSGGELLVMQRQAMRRAIGVPEERLNLETTLHRALVRAIAADAPLGDIHDALRLLARMERDGMADAEDYAQQVVETQAPWLTSPWMRDLLTLDARPALRSLKIPILAMIGDLDLQVPARANLAEIRSALDFAGNSRATILEMPGLNHLLQQARDGIVSEYLMIQETINQSALDVIAEWLRRHVGVKAPDSAR